MDFDNPLVAYIDKEAFLYNLNQVKKLHPGKEIILPVKANAYGHGDLLIVNEAVKAGVKLFAVARVDEGVNLRKSGIDSRIMILGVERSMNAKLAVENNIELSISDIDNLIELEKIALQLNRKIKIHVLVDTGMSRMGVDLSDLQSIVDVIKKSDLIEVSSVFTHFAKSDESIDSIKEQLSLFLNARNIFIENNINPEFFHCSNSGGVENYEGPDWTLAVRPGIMVYGFSQKIGFQNKLKPVMTLTAKVLHVKDVKKDRAVGYGHSFKTTKDVRLATVAIGYADGLPRICSNNLTFKINGKKFKQCGRISMDLTVVETDKTVNVGDTVYIFGNNENSFLTANDIANRAGTISYEILTGIGNRVKRVIV